MKRAAAVAVFLLVAGGWVLYHTPTPTRFLGDADSSHSLAGATQILVADRHTQQIASRHPRSSLRLKEMRVGRVGEQRRCKVNA